jgi:two-component system cell cycle response regulator
MSAVPKKAPGEQNTSTITKSVGELTTVGEFAGDLPDTKKFELVAVINFVSGPEKGRVVALHDKCIVGRSRSCEVTITDPSCSRQHAIFERRSGKIFVDDLKSTNGVRVNGARIIAAHELKEGDRVQLGDLTIVRFGFMPHAEASIQQDFYQRATRDGLTNAYNRKSFEEAFDREVAHCKRNGRGLGILLFDLDHFKKVNDTYGHSAGDAVLRKVSEAVLGLIRAEDIFARIGGEEFAILTRNESLDSLKVLGDRVRALIDSTDVPFESQILKVTISVGVSYMSPGPEAPDKSLLFNQADAALYEAKNSGRNKVMASDK